jgi:hypothetical protein
MSRSSLSKKRKAEQGGKRSTSGTEQWTVQDLFHDAAEKLPYDVVQTLDQEKVASSLNSLLVIDRENAVAIAVEILKSAARVKQDGLKNPARVQDLEQDGLKNAAWIQDLEQANASLEQSNASLEQANASLEQVNAKMSLLGLLELKDSESFKLEATGTDTSHTYPLNIEADVERGEFEVDTGPWGSSPELKDTLAKAPSALRAYAKETMKYSHEADIQICGHNAVNDAVYICNEIIKMSCTEPKRRLGFRREASLFSVKPDHTVVFDSSTGDHIMFVEDKRPCAGLENKPKIAGQVFDYLLALLAFGHANPFGVLTTFTETWVVWTGTEDCKRIASEGDRLTGMTMKKLVSTLPKARAPTANDKTPSPPQLIDLPPSANECRQLIVRGSTASNGHVSEVSVRKVILSANKYSPHELVPVLCNAIFCSLQNFQGQNRVRRLSPQSRICQNALKLTNTGYEWKRLNNMEVVGPAKTENDTKPNEYYVIDVVGSGSTSRAFRAVTSEGGECVIKMYVQRYEEKKPSSRKVFDERAEAAVKREVDCYHQIYGEELKSLVWHQMLNGRHCVILPYFEPVFTERRCNHLKEVRAVLTQCFKQHGYRYMESDMRWQHVGKRKDKIYLFDLADLEKCDNDVYNTYIEVHVKRLEERM